MKCWLKTTYCTAQEGAIARYGDDVWEDVCNTFQPGQMFTIADAIHAGNTLKHLGLLTRRHYMKAILNNVVAEYEYNPATDGPCPIARKNNSLWYLTEV